MGSPLPHPPVAEAMLRAGLALSTRSINPHLIFWYTLLCLATRPELFLFAYNL